MSDEVKDAIATLMKNAQKMMGANGAADAYQEMVKKQAQETVQGKAGGDRVVAHVNLNLELKKLEVQPECWQEDHAVLLELISGAVNQGILAAKQSSKANMGKVAAQMGFTEPAPAE